MTHPLGHPVRPPAPLLSTRSGRPAPFRHRAAAPADAFADPRSVPAVFTSRDGRSETRRLLTGARIEAV